LSGEQQQLLDDFSGVQGGRYDFLYVLSAAVGQRRIALEQLGKTENAAERLVQFVRDARRQLPDGGQAVRVHELFLQMGPLLLRLLVFDDDGDLSGDGVQQAPLVLQEGAILRAGSVLGVDDLDYASALALHDHLGRLSSMALLESGRLISPSVQHDPGGSDFRVLPCRRNQLDNALKHLVRRDEGPRRHPADAVQTAQFLYSFVKRLSRPVGGL
jgi:hypothetical protein